MKRTETDSRSLTDKEDRTHPPLPDPQKLASQTPHQGQSLLVNTQPTGDKTAMTRTAELQTMQLLEEERQDVEEKRAIKVAN